MKINLKVALLIMKFHDLMNNNRNLVLKFVTPLITIKLQKVVSSISEFRFMNRKLRTEYGDFMINQFSINCDLVAKNKSKEKIEKEIFLSFYFAKIIQWDTDFDVKVKKDILNEKNACLH